MWESLRGGPDRNGTWHRKGLSLDRGADLVAAAQIGTQHAAHARYVSWRHMLQAGIVPGSADTKLHDLQLALVNLAAGKGNTALHHAAGWGRLENMRQLLGQGADPALRNRDGKTALDLAEEAGRRRAADLRLAL